MLEPETLRVLRHLSSHVGVIWPVWSAYHSGSMPCHAVASQVVTVSRGDTPPDHHRQQGTAM